MSLVETVQPELLSGAIDQYVSTEVPSCHPEDRADQITASLADGNFETVDDIAVCEPGGRLLGLIPAARLFGAPPDALARELMDSDPPVVISGTGSEQATWKAVVHGESSLAVVDEAGQFRGLVPPRRLLGVLLREHDEDFARLGGYVASTRSARRAAEEPVARRLWHRFPWLVVGLAGAATAAWIVGLFEDQISADVRLAFFVPGVVYLADAVGTQTEALVVRGLSVGTPIRRALVLEAITGPALGLLLAALTFPAVWLTLGDADVAAAVSIALFAACAGATIVAAALPWAIARAGRDPAFGSGPLATVIQDLLSLVTYLVAVTLIVT